MAFQSYETLKGTKQGSLKGSGARPKSSPSKISAACERWGFLAHPNCLAKGKDSSAFVRSVGKECGVSFHGNSNSIYYEIQSPPWSVLGRGESGAHRAAVAVANGELVVGAWKNPVSGKAGHVALIVGKNHPLRTVPPPHCVIAVGAGTEFGGCEGWDSEMLHDVLYAAIKI
jgi:hypothetical protein